MAGGGGGATWKDNIYQFSTNYEGAEYQSATIEDTNNEGRFWSITVYNKDGFMFNGKANINSNVAVPNEDGTYTVSFGCEGGVNNIPVENVTGIWNAAMRHYTPSETVIGGSVAPMGTIAPVS